MKLRSFVLSASLSVPLALLGLAGCDNQAQDSAYTFGTFALTEDDQSADGFDDSVDPAAFEAEMGEAFAEDPAPAAGEEDPPEVTGDVPGAPAIDDATFVRRIVRVGWGRPFPNPAVTTTVTWKGQITSDVATIRVLRKLRFEATDKLVADQDPKSVTFETTTGPDHDGLLLFVKVPKASVETGTITFATGIYTKTVAIADLLDGFHEAVKVDETGNGVRVDTVPAHPCGHGLFKGDWKRLDARGGVFGGIIVDDTGAEVGKILGLWGVVGGKPRFKGQIQDPSGAYLGTLRGAWKPIGGATGMEGGALRGHWRGKGKTGAMGGLLRGLYQVGDEPGMGELGGAWLKVCGAMPAGTCAAEAKLPADAPECGCASGGQGCGCEMTPAKTCVEETPAP